MPRSLSGDLARLALSALLGLALLAGYTTFRIWQQGERDERAVPVDAVVVLGAAQYGGVPSPIFRARLDHAVELVLNGAAPWLVVTGGGQPGDRFSEAEAARAYAVEHGVSADRILAETTGRDTRESLANVAVLLRRNGLDRPLFVSDRTHMLRVLLVARDLGIAGRGSPTRTSPADLEPGPRLEATLHELAALGGYFFGP